MVRCSRDFMTFPYELVEGYCRGEVGSVALSTPNGHDRTPYDLGHTQLS